jgi:hypothetical protein
MAPPNTQPRSPNTRVHLSSPPHLTCQQARVYRVLKNNPYTQGHSCTCRTCYDILVLLRTARFMV